MSHSIVVAPLTKMRRYPHLQACAGPAVFHRSVPLDILVISVLSLFCHFSEEVFRGWRCSYAPGSPFFLAWWLEVDSSRLSLPFSLPAEDARLECVLASVAAVPWNTYSTAVSRENTLGYRYHWRDKSYLIPLPRGTHVNRSKPTEVMNLRTHQVC